VALEDYLRLLADSKKITLIQNSSNLGFVKTVNKGFKYCPQNDCIILNSDTVVHGNWIDRLLNIAESDQSIATITPFTNNGEICSFPQICVDNTLPLWADIAEIDQACSKNIAIPAPELPTGVGFCMYIRRIALDKTGYFDEEAFGRGYGEENDLCMRFSYHGFKNVIATNVFVYHCGGESFGAEKQSLVDNAIKTVEKKHPSYSALVTDFISKDCLESFRLSAIINLIADSTLPSILMLSHGIGGGTEKYIGELEELHSANANIFHLQPTRKDGVLIRFPEWSKLSEFEFDVNNADSNNSLQSLIQKIRFNLIHINHISGFEKYAFNLVSSTDAPYVITLHDYYFISGNPVLTGEDGIFSQNIALDDNHRRQDIAKNIDFFTADQWLEQVEKILSNATSVIAPCESIANVFTQLYPSCCLLNAPHIDQELYGQYPAVKTPQRSTKKTARSILVVGALSPEKGADILEAVAKLAEKQKRNIKFHLAGYAYKPLSKNIATSGAYKEGDLKNIISRINPDLVWFPSLWAETYSYTLSTILELGYPVAVPQFGAQYHRTKNRPLTTVFNSYDTSDLLEILDDALDKLYREQGEAIAWDQSTISGFSYQNDYLNLAVNRSIDDKIVLTSDQLEFIISKKLLNNQLQHKSVILKILVRLRLSRKLYWLSSLIPMSWQRKVKRSLYKSPLHDL
jgi:glycosyltransferase involved in cell wall biosynthesis